MVAERESRGQVRKWDTAPENHVHPEPVSVTLFRSKVFMEVIKSRWGHTRWDWLWVQDEWYPYKKEDVWIQRRKQREKTMWQWRQTLEGCSCKPRNTKDCLQPKKRGRSWEEAGKTPPLKPSESMALLTQRFWISGLQNWENEFLLFQATKFIEICRNSPRKLILEIK